MELIFLGTGPTGGVQNKGKSKRLESSALIKTPLVNVLVDVTRNFKQQSRLLPDTLDAVLITHAHLDAIGGIKDFLKWQIKKGGVVPIISLPETIAKIKAKFKASELLDLHQIQAFKKLQLGDLIVIPILVKHSIQRGFPTLGFHFSVGDKKLVYVSDTSGWNKKAERLMKNADVLVIDGAMWGKKIASHLTIQQILPTLCKWPVKKIIFTQIGHTAPRHQILQKEIQKICPKVLPAYDGMRLKT